jgi:hypothetical protein
VALPTSYLTSVKSLPAILAAIQSAQAPERFTQAFLEALEFKSTNDRLMIGVLKSLGFLDDAGKPKERYFRFLDQTQGAKVLAEGVREAYQDLFRVHTKAHELGRQEVINKFKTLGQGQYSESVLDKMATTFVSLAKLADFNSPTHAHATAAETAPAPAHAPAHAPAPATQAASPTSAPLESSGIKLGGLVYNIQIVLPESRDPAVYDALFQSLRRHLQ